MKHYHYNVIPKYNYPVIKMQQPQSIKWGYVIFYAALSAGVAAMIYEKTMEHKAKQEGKPWLGFVENS